MSLPEDLNKLTVAQLKAELKSRNLTAISGLKKDLVAALEEHVKASSVAPANVVAKPAPIPISAPPKAVSSAPVATSKPVAAPASSVGNAAAKPAANAPAQAGEKKSVLSSATPADPLQKLKERAERFGMALNVGEDEKKKARAARFGLSTSESSSSEEPATKKQKTSSSSLATAVAEQSPEELERLAKRAKKFGNQLPSGVPDPEELERRKAREARFATSAPSQPAAGGKKVVSLKGASEAVSQSSSSSSQAPAKTVGAPVANTAAQKPAAVKMKA
jgi:hypothetical protein